MDGTCKGGLDVQRALEVDDIAQRREVVLIELDARARAEIVHERRKRSEAREVWPVGWRLHQLSERLPRSKDLKQHLHMWMQPCRWTGRQAQAGWLVGE